MAKLVNVYDANKPKPIGRRQLPLVVDESLTMVMDLKSMGLLHDNRHVKSKILDEFIRKVDILTEGDLLAALQVTRLDMLHVLNQVVPCVGCRRSVERLYYQLFKYGYPTLDPIVVKPDGMITIREDKQMPQILCNLFHGHSARLNDLVDNQIRRNKKSHRCILHSLDSQRSRPITPVWQDVWKCMRDECKKATCRIDANSLHATLETYLRKHRFCGECRTKVLKAYTLLMEDPEPCKEKGYVSSLYDGIERCIVNKHIHLPNKTEYITDLISRAEPELLGSRRERHAKTLEIAQEEVLTCLGICMYERLHRIYIRMREEECTCRVFAAVAVDALCRNFETTIERIQGVSQLELLYAELTKEEQHKQLRKEQKKLKRKRKKERLTDQEGKENCNGYEFDDKEDITDKEDCSCMGIKLAKCNETCTCKQFDDVYKEKGVNRNDAHNCNDTDTGEKHNEVWMCKCNSEKPHRKEYFKLNNFLSSPDYGGRKENCSSSDHSHDCGYSSENMNGYCETESSASTLPSSPEGSELACSDECCQTDRECVPISRFGYGLYGNGQQLSLQEMVDDQFYCDSDSFITPEEVREYQINKGDVILKRQQLRETLKSKFARLCVYGPLQVPRLLVQSKYASN